MRLGIIALKMCISSFTGGGEKQSGIEEGKILVGFLC